MSLYWMKNLSHSKLMLGWVGCLYSCTAQVLSALYSWPFPLALGQNVESKFSLMILQWCTVHIFYSEHHYDLLILCHIKGWTQCQLKCIQNATHNGYDGWQASLLTTILFQQQHIYSSSLETGSFWDSTK